MIVKILSSSSSFNGVSYNTNKTEKNLGELMKVENFGYLQNVPKLQPEEYKNYLLAYSASNLSVKDKQFHAAISCSGREYDKHQLTKIAEAYLKEMGYSDNPYLIVYHKDTSNNHVHVVSSRINSKGKKINDRFEKKRSLSAIQKILQTDIKQSTEGLIRKYLTYNISSIAQLKLVFERQGYSASQNQTGITLRKNDDVQAVIPIDKIDALLGKANRDNPRIPQLKAIVNKYKESFNSEITAVYEPSKTKDLKQQIGYTSPLAQELKSKLGLDIVFHGKKDLPPYGYTIIDHVNKSVFKGGEIMPLKEFILNKTQEKQPHQKAAALIIKVDSLKEEAAVKGIFSPTSANISLITISKDKEKLMQSVLKSAIHEYGSIPEGLRAHKLELKIHNNQLYVFDKTSFILISAGRITNNEDFNLIANYATFNLQQKERMTSPTGNSFQPTPEAFSSHGFSNRNNEEQSWLIDTIVNADLSIAGDVDDEKINGKYRRRPGKSNLKKR